MNQRLKDSRPQKHKGTLGKELSFATPDNRNVIIIKALKKAEKLQDE